MIAVEIALNIEKVFTHSLIVSIEEFAVGCMRRDEQISNDASSFGIPID